MAEAPAPQSPGHPRRTTSVYSNEYSECRAGARPLAAAGRQGRALGRTARRRPVAETRLLPWRPRARAGSMCRGRRQEIRIAGPKPELLRTLAAASSGKAATFGVQSSVL